MTKDRRTSLRLQNALRKRAEDVALATRRSLNEIIELCLEGHLPKMEQELKGSKGQRKFLP